MCECAPISFFLECALRNVCCVFLLQGCYVARGGLNHRESTFSNLAFAHIYLSTYLYFEIVQGWQWANFPHVTRRNGRAQKRTSVCIRRDTRVRPAGGKQPSSVLKSPPLRNAAISMDRGGLAARQKEPLFCT